MKKQFISAAPLFTGGRHSRQLHIFDLADFSWHKTKEIYFR